MVVGESAICWTIDECIHLLSLLESEVRRGYWIELRVSLLSFHISSIHKFIGEIFFFDIIYWQEDNLLLGSFLQRIRPFTVVQLCSCSMILENWTKFTGILYVSLYYMYTLAFTDWPTLLPDQWLSPVVERLASALWLSFCFIFVLIFVHMKRFGFLLYMFLGLCGASQNLKIFFVEIQFQLHFLCPWVFTEIGLWAIFIVPSLNSFVTFSVFHIPITDLNRKWRD